MNLILKPPPPSRTHTPHPTALPLQPHCRPALMIKVSYLIKLMKVLRFAKCPLNLSRCSYKRKAPR